MGAFLGLVAGLGLLLIWRSGPRAPQAGYRTRWASRRTEFIKQAGIDGVSSAQLMGMQVISSAIGLILVQLLTSTLAVAACFAAFAFALPVGIVRRMRQRRLVALRELWPEAIDNLASAVRAGMSLPEGLAGLAIRGPEALRVPFGKFGASYRANGRFAESLDSLKVDLADPVGDRVCETLRVAREVGGTDLGTVLRTLSELLRVDSRARSELETRQSWTVNAARLAVAAPWLVLLMLGTESTTLRAFNSTGGVTLLGCGAAACVLAYRIMLRIGRLPEEPRVLR